MKLTFPHMGNAYVSVKVLLDTLGLDYYLPPIGSRDSFERGIANSPEFMCLPFKTVLGDFIQGLEHGADTILFGGGCGQCRLSYYGDLQQEILRGMGYRFNYIPLDFKRLTYDEFMNKLGPVLDGAQKARLIPAVTAGVRTVFAVDGLYRQACRVRCREKSAGETDGVMRRFEREVRAARGYPKTRDAIRRARRALAGIRTDEALDPVKIGIVGEIFLSSDPFTNLEIEQKLGDMGALAVNTMSVSEWIRKHFVGALLPVRPKDRAVRAAQPYMHTDDIGGHGIYTIGNAELMSRRGFDGIIQVYPFTCMPEIIAQSALGEIERKNGVPVMTLILDEMTAETGYVTRLEAFVDMLQMKKERESVRRRGRIRTGAKS